MNAQFQTFETVLAERGQVTPLDLEHARRYQQEAGGPLHQALLRIGAVGEEDMLAALSAQLGTPILDDVPSDPSVYKDAMDRMAVAASWLDAHKAALWMEGDTVVATARDVLDMGFRETLEQRARQSGTALKYALATAPLLEAAQRVYTPPKTSDEHESDDAQRLRELAEEAPVIDFVNRVFAHALKHKASDIHIEPFENHFQVRYRIDGILRGGDTEPRSRFDAVVSRLKLLSKMDIAERRLPQDGRQTIRLGGTEIDLRVSSLPGSWGESLVVRLLKKDGVLSDMGSLGLEGRNKEVLEKLLSNPNGVILVTGPTGSGKSTTLYKSIQALNNGVRKIITIEDPVEYNMAGVVQIPINANIGYTFARGLRAILRQDPDIIMVGEIRDEETAVIAAQAALTGHLVLSTLHTNSALAAVARLIDIGLEPYLVASSVRGLAAQRLVRRLCDVCAEPDPVNHDEVLFDMMSAGHDFGSELSGTAQWKRAIGCSACDGTGYKGRVAIFEIAEVTESLAEGIFQSANMQQLTRLARQDGFITMYENGLLKARKGLTTMGEVERVCGGGMLDVDQD
ncbi:MAG: ATPase, T2SS/T4P/T4SS family [Litorimonas sp.]